VIYLLQEQSGEELERTAELSFIIIFCRIIGANVMMALPLWIIYFSSVLCRGAIS